MASDPDRVMTQIQERVPRRTLSRALVVMVLSVSVLCCGGQPDFSIDEATDPFFVEDELLIEELRTDFSESLLLAAFPPPAGYSADDLSPALLLRNAFVNEMATALTEQRIDELNMLTNEVASRFAPVMARDDTRVAYATATDRIELLKHNIFRAWDAGLFGRGLVVLAGLQVGMLEVQGGSVEIVPTTSGNAVAVITDAAGTMTIIDFSTFGFSSSEWGGNLEDALLDADTRVDFDGRELWIPEFAGLLSRNTVEHPYGVGLIEFLRVVEPGFADVR